MAGLRGRVFGGYQLTDQLGGTGLAEVYRAVPTAGGREAAVKTLYPEFARQPGFLPNFRRIVSFSAKLVNHPHILPVLASGEEQGYLYLISPYVEHGTLRTWLQEHPRLTAADAAPFFRQLCGAVAYAHSLGIVHGNLKPSNIYLFEGRHVLLGDFGLLWDVRHLDMEHVGSGSEVVEFLAPETFHTQPGQAADIYGLGALLFALLAGRAPFTGTRPRDLYTAHAEQPVPHLAQIDATLTSQTLALDPIIQRAMAKRPEDRFPSAMAIVQAIETALASVPPSLVASAGVTPAGVHAPLTAAPAPRVQPAGLAASPVPVGIAPAATATPAMMSGATPPASITAGLGHLYPPFPPLAPRQSIEGGMEQLRSITDAPGSASAQQTPFSTEREVLAANLEIPHTARVPAPAPATPQAPLPAHADSAALGSRAAHGPVASVPTAITPSPLGLPARGEQMSAPLGDDRFDFGSSFRVAEQPDDVSAHSSIHLPSVPSGALPATPSVDRESLAPRQPSVIDATDRSHPLGGQKAASLPAYGRSQPGAGDAFAPELLDLPHLAQSGRIGQLPSDWEQPAQAARYVPGRSAPSWDASANIADDPRRRSGEDSAPTPGFHDQTYAPARSNNHDIAAQPLQPRIATSLRPQNENESDRYMPRHDTFASQRVWTTGTTAVRPKHRWLRPLLIILLLLLIGDSALVVLARPQLCPTTTCRSISRSSKTFLQSHLHLGSTATGKLTVSQSFLAIKTVVDGSASATFPIENTGAASLAWQVSTGLPWVTPTPASGTLTVGQQVQLTLSAQPRGVTPQAYSATITITSGSQKVQVPYTVTVGAGPQLATSPATLTFNTCGTSQTFTVSDTGGGSLNFTAAPSATDVMSLDPTSGTLNPGESKSVLLTLSCSAQVGSTYAVILVSNGGSAQVKVRYTA